MKLFLVPTPIGNLGDITLRAIEVLKTVDLVLCEDTRTSGRLLKHLGIDQKLFPFHQHNEHQVLAKIIAKLKDQQNIALITDAGTPGISDPGFLLVRACIEESIPIETLPGPAAFVTALIQSGLPADRFVFEGFLPVKKGRQSRIKALVEEHKTIIFYESPHRLTKTLELLMEHFGVNRKASISRELTKLHEETRRGSLQSLLEYFQNTPPKGEIVLVVGGVEQVED